MRLINIDTLRLKHFAADWPPYAILSHRWTDSETSYKEFSKNPHAQNPGAEKVRRFCEFVRHIPLAEGSLPARFPNVEWAWVDTACIDSRSSAELSEAINSMWRWYGEADFCLAYLTDVPGLEAGRTAVLDSLEKSDWFNRGWTLQELLAPYYVLFATANWKYVGDKHDDEILEILARRTGIDPTYLTDRENLEFSSVAQKLSWASARLTTREEDLAYCLLGLLDVNMPLLYGEGQKKAFRRLQFEIISSSADESIFAWRTEGVMAWRINGFKGCIAKHPQDFKNAGCITRIRNGNPDYIPRSPYFVTNQGLSLNAQARVLERTLEGENLKLRRIEQSLNNGFEATESYVIPLNCRDLSLPNQERCAIALHHRYGLTFRMIGVREERGWEPGDTVNKSFLLYIER